MANIKDYLLQILKARYGRDVRQSIHDAIHQCYEDGKAGSVDLEARELIDYKVGYPDYDNAQVIITTKNKEYTIAEDGYVFLRVSDRKNTTTTNACLQINYFAVVDVICSGITLTSDDDVLVKYTSPLFPVKAGDVVATANCGSFEEMECFFIPFR